MGTENKKEEDIMTGENCLDQSTYALSKKREIMGISLISFGIFLVPLIIPQILSLVFGANSFIANNSQYIVGTIVNTALIMTAIHIEGWKKITGIITLPSLSALAGGLVFSIGSIYTLYMIPAVWIGNFLIIYLYRKLFVQKHLSYIISSTAAILLKAGVIFAGYNLLLAVQVIPSGSKVAAMLFSAMGLNQVITAVCGSILAFAIFKLTYRKD